MGASVTPQTPPNTITFTPGGTVVINGSAIGGNNAVSIQIQNKEICYIDSSGNLNTASGSAGVTSFGAFGSSPSSAGATVAGSVATLQPADATHPGGVSTGAQAFAGVKTFGSIPVAAGITAPATTNLTYLSNVANSGTNAAHVFDNGVALSGTTWLATFGSNGAAAIGINNLGTIIPSLGYGSNLGTAALPFGAVFVSTVQAAASGAITFYGLIPNGSSAIGFVFDQYTSLSTAGARVASFQNASSEIFGIEFSGKAFVPFTDTSGTPGAGTANTPSGTSALVMGSGSSFKITNSTVGPNSIILVAYAGAPDSTAGAIGASKTSGGFNVYSAGVAAGPTPFNWWVLN